MKKILFASALLIAASITTYAGSNTTTTPMMAEKNISASIRSQIQFPAYLTESEGEHNATITFKVNACGTIAIQDIQADDEDLRANLLDQAASIKIDTGNLDTHNTYKVVVRFKTL